MDRLTIPRYVARTAGISRPISPHVAGFAQAGPADLNSGFRGTTWHV